MHIYLKLDLFLFLFPHRGLNVVHYSLDKDMLQLVEPGVHVSDFFCEYFYCVLWLGPVLFRVQPFEFIYNCLLRTCGNAY